MPYRILIAEDDTDIIELLTLYLQNSGLSVAAATNGVEALEVLRREPVNLALVDVMMPEMDGYELVRQIRADEALSKLPVIILSAKSMEEEKILGLNIGADFYITKPFKPSEVVAYVQALLRRFYQLGDDTGDDDADQLTVGDLVLDTRTFTLRKSGHLVSLTTTELKLVAAMMKQPGRIFTKAQLYECLNDNYLDSDSNTVMVHISNIRAKLEDDPSRPKYIVTVRGLGYKIEAN